jgi:excinuclease UvrABC nuclease subunit
VEPGVADLVWTSRTDVSSGYNEEHSRTIPASHGVVCVRDANSGVIALASTGDMRSFLTDRLGPTAAGVTDLRKVAATFEYVKCDSIFEADLAFMTASADLDPGLHDKAARKLRIWWLGTQVDATKAQWNWDTDPSVFEPGTKIIGPFYEKSSARRHAEQLDAAFELCRYPAELHRAPNGRPCVYKEMGQCPGACDGSEPLRDYQVRLYSAIWFDAHAVRKKKIEIELLMQVAVDEEDFEQAGALKAELERWSQFGERQLEVTRSINVLSYAALTKSSQSKVAKVLVIDQGRWVEIGGVDAEAEPEQLECVVEAARLSAARMRSEPGVGDLGVLGVLGRELLKPSRGGPEMVRLDGLDGAILLHASQRVLRMTGARPRNHADDE